MLRRSSPLRNNHLHLSDSETESDDLSEYFNVQDKEKGSRGIYIGKENYACKKNTKRDTIHGENREDMKDIKDESDTLLMVKKAEKYQEYMRQMAIPSTRGSPMSFTTWQGLAKSMKKLYNQPLHYLTHKLLKQWDQSRVGTEDESKPLERIIDPGKAEATIWGIEEFHRQCSSHDQLTKMWLSDPLHRGLVDQVIPY